LRAFQIHLFMNTRILMIASAVFLGLTGMAFTFGPEEFLHELGLISNPLFIVLIQLTGALFIGFAVLNYMAKGVLMGGIYSKPLVMGNLAHFTVAGLALLKAAWSPNGDVRLWGLAVIYLIFAAAFGKVMISSGVPEKSFT
jgi:hypothetical protein